jgi:hypothetical protein
MKKTFLLTIAIIAWLSAAATDRFYIEGFVLAPGETCTVSILLDNETAYTAFQTDLYLPDGLTVEQEDGDYIFDLTSRKSRDHIVIGLDRPNGAIRIISYSMQVNPYSGNSGALVTFNVTASADFNGGTIKLKNTLFTAMNDQEISFAAEECTVTTPYSGKLGDVNGDGDINVADVTALIAAILNSTHVDLAVADINGDNLVNVADVTALIRLILDN